MSTQTEDESNSVGELRFVFVEMLFALTIAEIAVEVASIAEGASLKDAFSSYAHLVLATVLVATSWIGWKGSVAQGNRVPVKEVFSLGFLVLLFDVTLVIFYFILARGAEKPHDGKVVPSADNETKWILIIFIGYFAWDILTKAVPSVDGRSFLRRLFGKELWARGWLTFICVILAMLIRYLLRDASTQNKVVLIDGALLSLVLLFRALKESKNPGHGAKGWVVIVCAVSLVVSGAIARFWQ